VHAVVFKQPLSRQAILNLYEPGQGISPHIDLPHRYADGIVGASLAGGCVLVLERAGERHDVYLPPRSVYVFSGEVRWEWTHGIPGREYDVVLEDCGEEMTLPRDVRVSATLRWMKEGADLLVEEGERPA
jgi:alkylated DNA repair dioxygenase AlkB